MAISVGSPTVHAGQASKGHRLPYVQRRNQAAVISSLKDPTATLDPHYVETGLKNHSIKHGGLQHSNRRVKGHEVLVTKASRLRLVLRQVLAKTCHVNGVEEFEHFKHVPALRLLSP